MFLQIGEKKDNSSPLIRASVSLLVLFVSSFFTCLVCSCSKDEVSLYEDVVRTPPTKEYHPALVVSIGDDDAIDTFLRQSSTIRSGEKGGFFSRLFPLLMSIGGYPASEAVECWRCGIDKGTLNETGKVMKDFCHSLGWEAMSHTMTARFYGAYVFDTYEDAMRSVENNEIELKSLGEWDNNTTNIFITSEQKNYWYTQNGEWEVVKTEYIRPKLKNKWGDYISENPTFPIEYQVKDSKTMIEEMLETEVKTFIPPADSKSYKIWSFASLFYPYMVGGVHLNIEKLKGYPNLMPLPSVVSRWAGFENSSGENKADDFLFEQWKTDFQTLRESGTYSIILGSHMYLKCWRNVIESELQSHGGTYPDSYVVPVCRPKETEGNILLPDPSTGLADWGEWQMDENGKITGHGWYPCPGTRLYQFWKFLLWIKSQGIEIMTVKDNLDRIANTSMEGVWIPSYFWAPYDNPEMRDFYFVGADGSTIRKG